MNRVSYATCRIPFLDDFGPQPLDNQKRLILLEIIEDRNNQKSMIIYGKDFIIELNFVRPTINALNGELCNWTLCDLFFQNKFWA